MKIELTPEQINFQQQTREFVDAKILPLAKKHDIEEKLDDDLLEDIKRSGFLGSMLSKENGGMGLDMISIGILNEEVGRACASVRSLLTVNGMVALSVQRWGTAKQKAHWLPKLSTGEYIGAFGLTEPNVGSDAKSVECKARIEDNCFILNGTKKWTTMGQIANLFLIIAQLEGKPTAFLVERSTPGLSIKPMHGLLGARASMIAELHLEDCCIPKENILGGAGMGLSHVALPALDYGRYTVSWGCIGTAQACLDECVKYVRKRKQFGKGIWGYQLIQQMITEMYVNINAAKFLCYRAGYLKDIGDQDASMETWSAKYFASKMVNSVANSAVQIHGGNGCINEYPIERFYRDARINEIIEGTSQMHELIIATHALRK